MAVCDEEQSFLVTMTKRGNSKVSRVKEGDPHRNSVQTLSRN